MDIVQDSQNTDKCMVHANRCAKYKQNLHLKKILYVFYTSIAQFALTFCLYFAHRLNRTICVICTMKILVCILRNCILYCTQFLNGKRCAQLVHTILLTKYIQKLHSNCIQFFIVILILKVLYK